MSIHDDTHDVAVIGAGAAGLAASIFAAEAAAKGDRPQRIVLLDGAKTIGPRSSSLGAAAAMSRMRS